MTYKRLIFKDSFTTSLNYEDLCFSLKKKLNKRFFKGYLSKNETLLYYYSEFINLSVVPKMPITQIKFIKPPNDKGQLIIEFKLVDIILIFFGAGCLPIWLAFTFNFAEPVMGLGRLVIPTIATIFIYLFLQIRYLIEIDQFKKDLEAIKTEIGQNPDRKEIV